MYLDAALKHIDDMPQSTYDEIIEKNVEMNVAHPFRDADVIIGTRLENPVKSTGLHSLVPIFIPEKGRTESPHFRSPSWSPAYIAGQRYESLIVIKAVIPPSGDWGEGSILCCNRFIAYIANSGTGGYSEIMP